LVAGGEVGFGDDFEEGSGGAVEVDDGEVDGVSAGGFVEEFAGVFLEVGAADADGLDVDVRCARWDPGRRYASTRRCAPGWGVVLGAGWDLRLE
jgi:hypothetical protein